MTSHSMRTFYSILLLISIHLSTTNVLAQSRSHDSVLGSNSQLRPSSVSSTSTPLNDDTAFGEEDMYADDPEVIDASTTDTPNPAKSFMNKTSSKDRQQSNDPAPEDYGNEGDHYHDDEVIEDENPPVDEKTPFGDSIPNHRPDQQPPSIETNKNKPSYDLTSTSRLPFVPSNFWRELFAKPGILVGIIGGVVIGMLSAILLVMFIIYRMRKKDEGSYALEEGPRKSPSHAYTRVSSREFFA